MASNRNSTPDGATSSLRPPTNRGHHLRASADMSGFSSPLSGSRQIRPSSEVYLNAGTPPAQNAEAEAYDKAAQKWLADLESYESTLDEMAAATLDQAFKDELSAIEQWFRVLSVAERTAALYALLQQTTPIQVRFFIAILQQMASTHAGIADPLSSRMSELMVNEQNRHSYPSRPPPSPTTLTNRNSQLDPATVSAMFPEAAAALATQRARYSQVSGVTPGTKSNRNSAIFETKPSSSLSTMSLANNPPSSPWRRDESVPQPGSNGAEGRPKSGQENKASGKETMGNWQAPPRSAGLRSPGIPSGSGNLQTTTISSVNGGNGNIEMPELSPYPTGGNWASMVNTPVVPMFSNDPMSAQVNADMVANATAMKLAAMSTVNNRFMIDSDVRKYRRSKPEGMMSPGLPSGQGGQYNTIPAIAQSVIMYNERGQPVHIPAAAMQAAAVQQQLAGQTSPGLSSAGLGHLASPQNNGFLTPYSTSPLLGNPTISLNQLVSGGSEGYISDHSDIIGGRGRSPRGRRGSSKPPEDPTDINLLNDIPAWLRSLRLHKYTDNLKDLKWQDLVELDDEALEKRGVAAVGARRKMLKVFEQVKEVKSDA